VPRIPGVNHQDAVRALRKAGFRVARPGKHIVMTDGIRIITIPVNAFTMGGIVPDSVKKNSARPYSVSALTPRFSGALLA
jgi:predicted RNA binding protein YcfA (HicA-like mRNA interferase family)